MLARLRHDGNQIRKTIKATGKVWLFGYDVFDRLRDAVLYASAGGSVETGILYDYDALDRRIRRIQPSANSEEVYFHDGWDIDSLEQRTWGWPRGCLSCRRRANQQGVGIEVGDDGAVVAVQGTDLFGAADSRRARGRDDQSAAEVVGRVVIARRRRAAGGRVPFGQGQRLVGARQRELGAAGGLRRRPRPLVERVDVPAVVEIEFLAVGAWLDAADATI